MRVLEMRCLFIKILIIQVVRTATTFYDEVEKFKVILNYGRALLIGLPSPQRLLQQFFICAFQ